MISGDVATKTIFVGLLVGLAHIASGFAVFIDPVVLTTTPLASLADIGRRIGVAHGFAGAILMSAGIMAVLGATPRIVVPGYFRAMLFFPQQILLLLQIWSISFALLYGVYPDGYAPQGGAWFILTDQIWAWILAVSHSAWLAAYIYGRITSDGRSS